MFQQCKLLGDVCHCPRGTERRVRSDWECKGPFSNDELNACYDKCAERHDDVDQFFRCRRSCQCINGCGTYTKEWTRRIGNFVTTTEESLCCDEHDRCYNTFEANKSSCDDRMYDCLLETAENDNWFTRQTKKIKFKAMWSAVQLGGNEAFESGQRDSTECVPKGEAIYMTDS